MAIQVAENNADRWLNTRQAAEYLGYAVQTLYNKVDANEIPYVKLGRSLRFRKSDLDRWVIEKHAESETRESAA